MELPLAIKEQFDIMQFQIKEQSLMIAKMQALISHYEGQLLYLKRRQFGVSSERTDSSQLQLSIFEGILNKHSVTTQSLEVVSEADNVNSTEEITYKRKKRKGKREEGLSALPVVRVDYELPEDKRDCPSCEEILKDTNRPSIRREIEIIPAQAIVKEHVTHSYICANLKCEGIKPSDTISISSPNHNRPNTASHLSNSTPNNSINKVDGSQVIIKANAPKPLIAGSLASPSLVAHIAYQKYSNGMPLYRIEKGFLHDGVSISRQNMSNWVIKCVQTYLVGFYDLMKSHLLSESVIHSDGTSVQVLKEEGRAAQTKSCQWVYRTSGASDKKIVIYKYTQTKGQVHPKKFLTDGDFSGYLHCDGDGAYKALPDNITLVGCWAHARRYFENIIKPMSEDARKKSDAAVGVLS